MEEAAVAAENASNASNASNAGEDDGEDSDDDRVTVKKAKPAKFAASPRHKAKRGQRADSRPVEKRSRVSGIGGGASAFHPITDARGRGTIQGRLYHAIRAQTPQATGLLARRKGQLWPWTRSSSDQRGRADRARAQGAPGSEKPNSGEVSKRQAKVRRPRGGRVGRRDRTRGPGHRVCHESRDSTP